MIEAYTVKIWGDTYSLRANWAEASSQIERDTEDGWMDTGTQVADYRHSPEAAMRAELQQSAVAGGDDILNPNVAAEIDAALAEESR